MEREAERVSSPDDCLGVEWLAHAAEKAKRTMIVLWMRSTPPFIIMRIVVRALYHRLTSPSCRVWYQRSASKSVSSAILVRPLVWGALTGRGHLITDKARVDRPQTARSVVR